MTGLNLNFIKYFCDAVKLGSISSSARMNFVTLSAISQAISQLEKTLGIDLLAHHPNRFRLTPAGEVVFRKGCELLRHAEEFCYAHSNEVGPLEFASIYSFGLAVIPQYLKKFTEAHPHTKVNFHLANNMQIKEMLRAGLIDFGIVGNDYEVDEYESKDIYSGYFELFVAKNATVAKQKRMGFIFATYDVHENRVLQEAYHDKFGTELPICVEVSSWEAIANLVTEGAGIGYLPDYMEKKEMKKCALDLKMRKRRYEICTIFPKGMRLRQSSEIFSSYFTNK